MMARWTLTFGNLAGDHTLDMEVIKRLCNSAQPKPKMFTIDEASARNKIAPDAWMQTIRALQNRLQAALKREGSK